MLLPVLAATSILLALCLAVLSFVRARAERDFGRLWSVLDISSSGERFTEDLVDDVPEPARRYLLHAIRPGALLAKSVRLTMEGGLRLKPDADYLPMTATEVLAGGRGFVWRAKAGTGILTLGGADSYVNGQGRVRFWAWGIVPAACASGPDVSRSARGRLASETIWLPTALLPQNGVRWERLDDETAEATWAIDGEEMTVTFVIAPDGSLRQLSMLRWRDKTEDGTPAYVPFGGTVAAERTFGGCTIPSELSVGWHFGTERYAPFFRCTVTDAEFR